MITCGWCNRRYAQWQSQCDSCGGPLPARPGMELGPRPPDAPRALPKGFVTRACITRNLSTLLGLGFLVLPAFMLVPMLMNKLWLPALFPGFFALGGIGLLRQGIGRGRGLLRAFRHGAVEEGKVVSIGRDYNTTVNGSHPWKLTYHFHVNGQWHEGKLTSFDSTLSKRQPGQPLWVLYLPGQPEVNTLYPPVR